MIEIFHFNTAIGAAEVCLLGGSSCKYGASDKHYTSVEAVEFVMGKISQEELTKKSTVASSSNSNAVNFAAASNAAKFTSAISAPFDVLAILEKYHDKIRYADEVYVHPQGKVGIVNYHSLTIYKDSRRVKSSATLPKLQNGYGKWVKVSPGQAAFELDQRFGKPVF